MAKRTIMGRIMDNSWGKPCILTMRSKETDEKKEICEFRIIDKEAPNAEAVKVVLTSTLVFKWLTAGRRVLVSGVCTEDPRFGVSNGAPKMYTNPKMVDPSITFLDLPITKEVEDVLQLISDNELFSEEEFIELKMKLTKAAEEKFEAGRSYKTIGEGSTTTQVEVPPADPEADPM